MPQTFKVVWPAQTEPSDAVRHWPGSKARWFFRPPLLSAVNRRRRSFPRVRCLGLFGALLRGRREGCVHSRSGFLPVFSALLPEPAKSAKAPFLQHAPLAQLDRALASGAKGRRFESYVAYEENTPSEIPKVADLYASVAGKAADGITSVLRDD